MVEVVEINETPPPIYHNEGALAINLRYDVTSLGFLLHVILYQSVLPRVFFCISDHSNVNRPD